MRVVRYRPNPAYEAGIRAQVQHQKGMAKITERVAATIRMVAPHGTGYYERRVKARGTRIRTLDNFWHLVEYGSVNNPPYAPLRRGIRAAGLRFKRLPKATAD